MPIRLDEMGINSSDEAFNGDGASFFCYLFCLALNNANKAPVRQNIWSLLAENKNVDKT